MENAAFIDSISNIRNVWIGLYYSLLYRVWRWSDSTSFDYGNISTTNQSNPWNENISMTDFVPDALSCVMMNIDTHYQWQIKRGNECEESAIFICNHCNGKLIKYVIINNRTSFDEADNICDIEMDTHLMSIHNEEEYVQSKRLCLYGTDTANDCWIGLRQSVTQYHWIDGTDWNYANNLSIYPWSVLHNDKDDQCVAFSANNSYLWIKDDCFNKKRIICTIQSELCYADNWMYLYNQEAVQFDECQITKESENKLTEIVNIRKQWINNNGELVIEYVFKTTQINNETGVAAVSIYNFAESLCDGYNIGIIKKMNEKRLFITRYYDNVYNEIYSVYINEGNRYNTLNIKIVNGTHFDVKWNDVQYILIDDEYFNETERANSVISGFIGLKTYNLLIESKSLYVSGSPVNIDTNQTQILSNFNQCVLETTLEPISTLNPELNIVESHKVCVTLKFKYESDKSIVQNITNFINDVHCLRTLNDDDTVNVSLIGKYVTINAAIFVCNINYTKEILTEYIQNIDDISEQQILLNCTIIEDVMIEAIEKDVSILIGIGVFVGCLCIAMILIIYRSREIKHSEAQAKDEDERKTQIHFVSGSDLFLVDENEIENGELISEDSESAQRKLTQTESELNNSQDEADRYMIPIIRNYLGQKHGNYESDDNGDDNSHNTSSSETESTMTLSYRNQLKVAVQIISMDNQTESSSSGSAPIAYDTDNETANEIVDLLKSSNTQNGSSEDDEYQELSK